jgi:type II secretory ATPase GspE/PulE/Tfp pilus assembly ATPase PilB-like protein
VCRHCAQEDADIPESIRDEMAKALGMPPEQVKAWKGRGCVECNHRGQRGRVAVYEFFLVSESIADQIQPGLRTGELRAAARQLGWKSLREMAWLKVQRGQIPISEQERWTRQIDPAVLAKNP